jgi:hypothetical protein
MKLTSDPLRAAIAVCFLLAIALLFTGCSYFRWGERSPDEIRSMPGDQQTNNGTLFRSELDR